MTIALPKLEPIGATISASTYSPAFEWIMDRLQDGNVELLDALYAAYEPTTHSAEFMSGLLRCSYSQKRNISTWLPTLKLVAEVLGDDEHGALYGMDPVEMEKELLAEAKPDPLGAMFDRQILNVHPSLIREG